MDLYTIELRIPVLVNAVDQQSAHFVAAEYVEKLIGDKLDNGRAWFHDCSITLNAWDEYGNSTMCEKKNRALTASRYKTRCAIKERIREIENRKSYTIGDINQARQATNDFSFDDMRTFILDTMKDARERGLI